MCSSAQRRTWEEKQWQISTIDNSTYLNSGCVVSISSSGLVLHQLIAGTTDFMDPRPSMQVPEPVLRQQVKSFSHPPLPVGFRDPDLGFPSWSQLCWGGGGCLKPQKKPRAPWPRDRASVWFSWELKFWTGHLKIQTQDHRMPGFLGCFLFSRWEPAAT